MDSCHWYIRIVTVRTETVIVAVLMLYPAMAGLTALTNTDAQWIMDIGLIIEE